MCPTRTIASACLPSLLRARGRPASRSCRSGGFSMTRGWPRKPVQPMRAPATSCICPSSTRAIICSDGKTNPVPTGTATAFPMGRSMRSWSLLRTGRSSRLGSPRTAGRATSIPMWCFGCCRATGDAVSLGATGAADEVVCESGTALGVRGIQCNFWPSRLAEVGGKGEVDTLS